MGLFSKDIKTLDDLFHHQLQDIYYAEKQIEKNLPMMAEKATNSELKAKFETHLRETTNHIARLDSVFQAYGQPAKGVDCEAIDGIIKEAKHVAGNVADPEVLDAALLASAQAVEHYEITRYGTLIAWAKELGLTNLVAPLEQNLEEEYKTDKALTALAEQRVNQQAA
ncbi:YciE/YciF ferroxidase family protein [Terrihabitans sp. B22-R8]|uniref:YciE/YciF ferroxidase family protein n=1 Tax=Terrihabitans sp. B22-R8 TaxID=3425128 RepID=UPI00403C8C5A